MRSSMSYALAVRGGICPPTFRHGRRSFTIFVAGASGGSGRACTTTCMYHDLHAAERERGGREAHPSAAILDAQSVKTVEESAHIGGHDGNKWLKGRKRHPLADPLGQ